MADRAAEDAVGGIPEIEVVEAVVGDCCEPPKVCAHPAISNIAATSVAIRI